MSKSKKKVTIKELREAISCSPESAYYWDEGIGQWVIKPLPPEFIDSVMEILQRKYTEDKNETLSSN